MKQKAKTIYRLKKWRILDSFNKKLCRAITNYRFKNAFISQESQKKVTLEKPWRAGFPTRSRVYGR